MTSFNTQATPRIAWQQKGRRHALAGEKRQPPEKEPEKRWYLDGYRGGAREKLRLEANA